MRRRDNAPPEFIIGDFISVGGIEWKVIDDTRRFCERMGVPQEAGFTIVHPHSGEWRKLTTAEMCAVLADDNAALRHKVRHGEPGLTTYVEGKRCPKHPEAGMYTTRRCRLCDTLYRRARRMAAREEPAS